MSLYWLAGWLAACLPACLPGASGACPSSEAPPLMPCPRPGLHCHRPQSLRVGTGAEGAAFSSFLDGDEAEDSGE